LAKGLPSPIICFEGSALKNFAARKILMGRQAQPRPKVFFIGPLTHTAPAVGAAFYSEQVKR